MLSSYPASAHADQYERPQHDPYLVAPVQRIRCSNMKCCMPAHPLAEGLCMMHGLSAYRNEIVFAAVAPLTEYHHIMQDCFLALLAANEADMGGEL